MNTQNGLQTYLIADGGWYQVQLDVIEADLPGRAAMLVYHDKRTGQRAGVPIRAAELRAAADLIDQLAAELRRRSP